MSLERDRSWARGDANVASETQTGSPGKRGHTDRLTGPIRKPAATGTAHETSLTGTSWLSGVLGFGGSKGEADAHEEHDEKKDPTKDKDKKKKDGDHAEHAEADEGEGEGEGTGYTLTSETFGSDGDSGSSSESESESGETSGESDQVEGSGSEHARGDAAGAGGAPAAGPKLKLEHHTKKLAPGNANDTRARVAVGELVDFTSTVAGTWLATIGTATGPSALTFTWTAPASPGTAVIKCTTATGKSVSKTLTVIAPSSLKFKKASDTGFPAGQQGAQMVCNITVGPSSVCFGNVQWLEIPGPATGVWGYFKGNVGDLQHHPNPNWLQWSDNNDGLTDTAGFWGYPPPWKAGGWTWVIPNHYQVVGAAFSNHFVTTHQVFTMTKNGTSKVTKGGQATTPRKP